MRGRIDSLGASRGFEAGDTADAVVRHGVATAGLNCRQQPFTRQTLAHQVREALAGV